MSGIFTSLQISRTLFLIIPVKKTTGETRGPSGGSGDGEAAIQRDPEDEEAVFCSRWFLLFCSASQLGGEVGTHTLAGFLQGAAETFRKSLQRQKRQGAIFSSKLIQLQSLLPLTSLLPSPPPCCPHSLLELGFLHRPISHC